MTDEAAATRLAQALQALTPRARAFTLALLADPVRNASAAYKRAGYKCSNPRSVESNAARLLSSDKVQAALRAADEPTAAKTLVTVERIEREWARIAFARATDVMTWSSSGGVDFIDSEQLDDDARAAVREVSEEVIVLPGGPQVTDDKGEPIPPTLQEVRKRKVVLHDKTRALVELGKRHGFYDRPKGRRRGGITDDLVDTIRRRVLGIDDEDGER